MDPEFLAKVVAAGKEKAAGVSSASVSPPIDVSTPPSHGVLDVPPPCMSQYLLFQHHRYNVLAMKAVGVGEARAGRVYDLFEAKCVRCGSTWVCDGNLLDDLVDMDSGEDGPVIFIGLPEPTFEADVSFEELD